MQFQQYTLKKSACLIYNGCGEPSAKGVRLRGHLPDCQFNTALVAMCLGAIYWAGMGRVVFGQKQVRLLHARTLLMAGEGNATSVAFGVGYESPNQFSREYARQFGLPPSKDVLRLRGEAA